MQKRGVLVFLFVIVVLLPFVSSFFLSDWIKFTGEVIKKPHFENFEDNFERDEIIPYDFISSSYNLLENGKYCFGDSDCESGVCSDTFFNLGNVSNPSTNPEKVCHTYDRKCVISKFGSEVVYGYRHCYNSSSYKTCFAKPGNLVNSWSQLTLCKGGQVCEEGLGCVISKNCSEGQVRCTGKNVVEKCLGGVWQHQIDCGLEHGQQCVDGVCKNYPNIICVDSDEGDIYTKGSVYLNGVLIATDACFAEGSDYLRENNCYPNQDDINRLGINYVKVKCENGCKDGACISKLGNFCVKQSGRDIFSRGYTVVDGQKYYDSCYTEDYLLETYCDENNLNANEKVFCYSGCENGACKQMTSKCFDTDAEDPYTRGQVQLENGSVFNDFCKSEGEVTEYICSGDNAKEKTFICSNGCEFGKCLNESCIDYDGGNNYFVASKIRSYSPETGFSLRGDYCSDSRNLVEATCVNGEYQGKYYSCPKYCLDGACVDSISEFNFYSQIFTEKDSYLAGEQIDLSSRIATINSNSVKELGGASKHMASPEYSKAVETSEGTFVLNNDELKKRYVIEFEEEAVLDKFASLSKRAEENEGRFIAKVPILKNLILTNENLGSRVSQYSYELERNSNKLENRIDKIRKEKNLFLTGNAVLNEKETIIKSKYKYSFYGVGVELTKDELKKIENLSGVKGIYLDEKSKATSYSVNELFDMDNIWNTDSFGNRCDLSGKECLDGSGIKIAIIDSGVDYTHPDLGGCFGVGCKVEYGYDYVNDDNDPMDDNGHGTHCASVAAGKGKFDGIAPEATIYAYKVLDEYGSGWNSDILLAIENSIDPNGDFNFSDGVDVISLSLGYKGSPDDFLSRAVDKVSNLGIPVVTAAGNSGPSYRTVNSPGVAESAITVGAVDFDKEIFEHSSRGPVVWDNKFGSVKIISKPDVVSYGINICAAKSLKNNGEGTNCGDGDYVSLSGTSMATPQVAGLVALIRQKNKELSPVQIKNLLKDSAEDLNLDNEIQGAGLVSPQKLFFEDSSQFILDKYYLDLGEISIGKSQEIIFSVKNQLQFDLDLTIEAYVDDSNAKIILDSNSMNIGGFKQREVRAMLDLGNKDSKPYELKSGYFLVKSAMYEKKINFVYYVSDKSLVGNSFLVGEGINFMGGPVVLDFFDYNSDGELDTLACFHGECFIYYNEEGSYNEKFFYRVPPISTGFSSWRDYSLVFISHEDLNGDGIIDVSFSGISGRIFILYGGEEKSEEKIYTLNKNQEITFEGIKLKLIRSYHSDINPGQAVFEITDSEFLDTRKEWFNTISPKYSNLIYYRNNIIEIQDVTKSGEVKIKISKSSVTDKYLGDFGEKLNSKLIDYDGDGDKDIVYFKGSEWNGNIYALENNEGTFGSEKIIFTGHNLPYLDFDFVDYDGDGDLDLVYSYILSSDMVYLRVFENRGNGIRKENNKFIYDFNTLYISPSSNPFILDDFDLDGDLDFVVGFGDGKVSYLENKGGTYEERMIHYYDSEVMGLNSVEFNSEGKKDLFISTFNSLYYKENYLDKGVEFREVSKLRNEGNTQSVFDLKMSLQKKSSSSWNDQFLVVDKKGVVLDSGKTISLGLDKNVGWNAVDVSTTSKGDYRVYLEVKNGQGEKYTDSYEFLVK